jgi:Zn-dependent peptidase ImmA (M78 family)/transcriptional regulator with XRE-family HTH domain
MKATVKPVLLQWARRRASLTTAELAQRLHVNLDRVEEWENTGELTLKQLEDVARVSYTPIGYLFLPEPPVEKLPIPDFRTVGSQEMQQPSPNLLDVIHQCQRRQNWFRDYQINVGAEPLAVLGKTKTTDSVSKTASEIRRFIGLEVADRAQIRTWEEALSQMIERIENAGILVMKSGVVGNNPHRPLLVEEFRGFALFDEYAPLIFINGSDTKAAQMFTLAHELAHLWLGESGVSNLYATMSPNIAIEKFCNHVAAELLVPLREFVSAWNKTNNPLLEARRLAGKFKVSTLVLLRRALDAGLMSQTDFEQHYDEESKRLIDLASGRSGGDFYLTQKSRLGSRFAQAIIESTLEGRTLYRDAFQLLGVAKVETFNELARTLKFAV